MKMKLLPLFLMVLMVISLAQPIFADNPQLGDTKIAEFNRQPLHDITVSSGDIIELQARLYWYGYKYDYDNATWIPQVWHILDFYVYRSNADGTNGELLWSDSARTNFFTTNAIPIKFIIEEKGTYNLLVKYEGKLKHCSATAKIYVV